MKKQLLLTLVFGAFSLIFSQISFAQGCVAIRQMGCSGSTANSSLLTKGQWQASANYRYFRSYKHFRGSHEEKERVELGTEVINLTHALDLGLSYSLSNRLSVSATLPIISYDRSSLYEHYGNSTTANPEQKRFHTGAFGIGDLRLSGAYWLLNPEKHTKTNISVGVGIKLPTGNENVNDEFHKRKATDGTDSIVVKPVDQSIQLGDGGVGVSLEVQAFTSLSERFLLYFSGFYMSNPRETNKTLTRGGTVATGEPLTAYHSVADQMAGRLGVNYVVWPAKGLAINAGGRMEGVPAKDLIGGSEGFRRPGYVVSAEPGLSFQRRNTFVTFNVPVALYRNRVKSVFDLADPTGQRHGDAAFADYSINIGLTWRFGGAMHKMDASAAPMWKDARQQN